MHSNLVQIKLRLVDFFALLAVSVRRFWVPFWVPFLGPILGLGLEILEPSFPGSF